MKKLKSIIQYSKKLKLLYVEDNESARNATLVIFNQFFDEIVIAVDGEDGLEKLAQNDVDLIITDINMPKLNGLEMTKNIRDSNRDIPILILSAYNESGFFIESIKMGVDGYLLKPIEIDQFLESLKKIIEKIKIADEVHLLHQYQDITDVSTMISKANAKGELTYVNDAFCQISGYTFQELLEYGYKILQHPNSDANIYEEILKTVKYKKSLWQGILKYISKNGETFYLKTTIKPILNLNGDIIEFIAIKSDITNTMDQKKRINNLLDITNEYVVVFIKIESFDDIDKYYGKDLSQKIEEKFGDVLLDYLDDTLDFKEVFILGNGEYVIYKSEIGSHQNIEYLKKSLLSFQQKVNDAQIHIEDIEYDISIIVSLSYEKNTYENAQYGLKKLIEKKEDFIVANNIIENEKKVAENNLSVIRMIKEALENKQIIVYFQPIIDNSTKIIHKYETLVRIIVNDEVIAPYHFLDISKKGKYYYQITSSVLDQAFEMLYKVKEEISINISALDIEKKVIREKIFFLLETHKKHANRIVFELLEDEEIKDFEKIKSFISKVKEYGVKIAIDDFGTGYSNFERLLDYQPDILKIDACLIKNIVYDEYSRHVVETIVTFAKKQNIQTIGEYVENRDIYELLHTLGVDYSQGYYFGKPDKIKL